MPARPPSGQDRLGDQPGPGDPKPDLSRPEVLETEAPRWEQRWQRLPARRRRTLVRAALVAAVLALVGTGIGQLRAWQAERDRREFVGLEAALEVWTSSSSPAPAGFVGYYALIRNTGYVPLEVTAVQASSDRVRVSARDDVVRWVDAGDQIRIPLSARLTCSSANPAGPAGLSVELGIRRGEEDLDPRRLPLEGAGVLLDAGDTLCSVRPALRDHELSGPILATSAGGAGDAAGTGAAPGQDG